MRQSIEAEIISKIEAMQTIDLNKLDTQYDFTSGMLRGLVLVGEISLHQFSTYLDKLFDAKKLRLTNQVKTS